MMIYHQYPGHILEGKFPIYMWIINPIDMWIINAMFVASTGSANLPVPCEKQRPHICQMWSYYPTAELTDFEASYQWPAVNNHYLTVPCECRHQCLFLSFLGRHDCEKITARRYVHDLYDVIKTVFLSLPAWHTRLFTDSIHNIRVAWSDLHRGNRRRKRLCNCLLTLCVLQGHCRHPESPEQAQVIFFGESYCACKTGIGRVDKEGKCLDKTGVS